MSFTTPLLLHTAKELLAAAVLELFPGTQLVKGEVTGISFSYEFLVPEGVISSFGPREIQRLDDHMRLIAFEKRKIFESEMMNVNAQSFFESIGQYERAEEIAEIEDPLVPLFRMGGFSDICPSPYLSDSSEVKHFKILDIEHEDSFLKVSATASISKEGLRELVKAFKEAKKRDPLLLGEEMGLFALSEEGEIVFLSKGESLRQGLIEQWRTMHAEMGFQFVHATHLNDLKKVHQFVFETEKSKRPYRVASLQGDEDLASIFTDEGTLLPEIISSLHFIEQTIKIFQLERRLVFSYPQRKKEKDFFLLQEGLKALDAPFQEEFSSRDVSLEFCLVDGFGRICGGPRVTVDIAHSAIHRSLFGSFDEWVMRLIEKKR